jgi:hypothetical protein
VLFLLPTFALTFGLVDPRALSRRFRETRLVHRVTKPFNGAVAVLTFVVLLLPFHASWLAIQWSVEPIEAFREASLVVEGAGVETVISDSRRPFGIQRYLPAVVIAEDEAETQFLICSADPPFAFIDHDHIREWPPPTECLVERGGVPVQFDQRRRGTIRVWIVPEAVR